MDIITSTRNPRVKLARSLRRRKHRERHGLFLVEGLRHLGEAYEAGADVAFVCHAPGQLDSAFGDRLVKGWQDRGVPVYETTPEVLAWVAERDGPQGLLAVARQRWLELSELNAADHPWAVAVQCPQDPGNLGTILRTLDAVAADALITLDGGVDPYHPTAVRASLGALFWHPVAAANQEAFSDWASAQGYFVYGTSAHAPVDYRALNAYNRPRILLLGSEREGLPEELAALCTKTVRLPMEGQVRSLNLAVAAGVLLYDMAARENSAA